MDQNNDKPKQPAGKVIKSFLRIMNWAWQANRFAFPAFAICLIVVSLTPFLQNFINSKVIDQITKLLTIDPANRNLHDLITFVILVVLVSLTDKVVWAFLVLFEKMHFFGLTRFIELKFLKKASELDMYHYESPESNSLIQKVKDIYEYKPREVANRSVWMIGDIARILTSVGIVLSFSFPAFLLVLGTTIPSLIVSLKMGRGAWGIWDANTTTKKRFWWSRDMLSREDTLMELRIFRTKDYLVNVVQDIYDSFTNKEKKSQVRRTFIESLVGNISTLGTLGFWVIAINATLNGQITIGLLTFYVSSIGGFSDALSNIFRNSSKQYEDSLYLVDFFKFMDLTNKIKPGHRVLATSEKPPLILFKNVSFKYPGTDKYVLKDFNLDINPGDRIAFVGVNGAGKTTIIKLLCRFYDVTEGEILVDGVNIKNIDMDSLYSKIGVLFQEFVRYTQFDVRKNIELGDVDKVGMEEQIKSSLFKADATKFVDEYKYKLDQILDKSFDEGINPSGGQWQRIALARAFFRDAPILILDEPTSAIDAKGEYEIFERLYEFSQNKTLIIVSHRFSTVRQADKIYVIDHGRIIEQGTHEQLMSESGKYAEAFNVQAEGYK